MECTNSVKVFTARVGAPFKNDQAQVVGESLDEIRKKFGGFLKSKDIVDEASKKKSPLHEHFEWDDTNCGIEYRLQQARNITNHIVERVVVDGNPVEQRSFVHVVNEESERVYVSLQDAIETVDYRKQLLDKMITILENLTITMKLFKGQEYPK